MDWLKKLLNKSPGVPEFRMFPKIPRWSREVIVTEKIDGTNGVVYVSDDLKTVLAGSRSRWLTDDLPDHHGFRKWVQENAELLRGLGPGTHFGEWWGQGIARNYKLKEKRWSLFNVSRWGDGAIRPSVCGVVPILWRGPMDKLDVEQQIMHLRMSGSKAAPGFMKPEGIVIYHVHGNQMFKKTLENDDALKLKVEP